MNNDIKKIKVKHHEENGNVSWEEVILTAVGGGALLLVLHIAHAI